MSYYLYMKKEKNCEIVLIRNYGWLVSYVMLSHIHTVQCVYDATQMWCNIVETLELSQFQLLLPNYLTFLTHDRHENYLPNL